jgi:formylglycine-generating enzyme required for sulfatase activity
LNLPAFQHQKQWSPGEDTPINAVSWYDAARYCDWLSEQEKVPKDQWCYEPNAKGEYAEGMKVKPNYRRRAGRNRMPGRRAEGEKEFSYRRSDGGQLFGLDNGVHFNRQTAALLSVGSAWASVRPSP